MINLFYRHRAATVFLLLIGCLCVSGLKDSARTPAKPKKEQPKKPPDPSFDAQQKVIDALNGTRWDIQLSPLGGEKGKPVQDVISFDGRRVSSEKLASEGYASSNFTIAVGADGVPVWETMQTGSDSSVIFWRGEIHGESVRGTLSRHPADGDPLDWAFSGKRKPAVEDKPETAPPSAAPVQGRPKPAGSKPKP